MNSRKLKESFQDEIKRRCVQCGVDQLVAYWDEELEYYIYLTDDSVCCVECQTVAVASELA